MPTYDHSGEETLKFGPDVFLPGKRTYSKQFVTHDDLTLVSELPSAENIPFGGKIQSTLLYVANSGEIPIGPYAEDFVLQGIDGAVAISGEVRTEGFVDGSIVTLRGASGENTVTIKDGVFYKTSLQGDIALSEGDILMLKYIQSKDVWAQLVYQPF